MLKAVTEVLDRLAIRSACASVLREPARPSRVREAQERLQRPDFFSEVCGRGAPPDFTGKHEFRFESAVESPWKENNVVFGKLFRAGKGWQQCPSVVLLHGWNGEYGYYWQFPFLARQLNRAGLNTAMIELPYHAQRRPREAGAMRSFLSHDLLHMGEAVRQALSDVRSLMNWLLEQGSPRVGFWGVSLGAWLAGLLAAHEPRTGFSVLMTPVARMDRAFAELPFCEPIRRGLNGSRPDLSRLNLVSHRPVIPPRRILIVKSEYDLFAPGETIEEVWQAWGKPDIWRVRHGHISVLGSLPVLRRTVRWIRESV